jgi:hypothetical protein
MNCPLVAQPPTAMRMATGTAIAIGDSTVYASACTGFFELLCALSMGRFQFVRNAGVNGNTTTQMVARFDADVGAYKPSVVFMMGSVNNIGASVSVAQAVIDYTSMINRTRAWGGTPILVAACPYDTSPSGLQAYNIALCRLAQTLGVQFVDPWKTCVLTSNGHWIDSTYTPDGTHPTPLAARIGATYALTQLTLPTFYPNLPQNNADTNNKISNGLFLNGSGGTPTGWTVDAAFTSTQSAGASDVLGNWWNLAFSALAAYKLATGPISFSGLAVGDTVQIVARVKSVGFEANGVGVSPGAGKVDAVLSVGYSGPGGGITLIPSLGGDLAGGVYSATAVIPATTSGLSMSVAIGPRSSTVSGTLSIAQLGLFKV